MNLQPESFKANAEAKAEAKEHVLAKYLGWS